MHIAEGLLPVQWAAGYMAVAGAFVAKGIHEYKKRAVQEPLTKQLTGMMVAAVFIISLLPIPVPITGTSSHPGGTPLAAILMGPWIATVAGFVSMLLQALFFSHGGLTTLGANTISEGIAGGFTGYLVYRVCRGRGLSLALSAGLAGFIGDVIIYTVASGQLALAIHGDHSIRHVFLTMMVAYMPTQLPLAVVEGCFTGLTLRYIAQHRPDILIRLGALKVGEATGVEVAASEK